MMFRTATVSAVLLATSSSFDSATAFLAPQNGVQHHHRAFNVHVPTPMSASSSATAGITSSTRSVMWSSSNSDSQSTAATDITEDTDDVVARLRAQAAKLRAEASNLEAEKADSMAKAAQMAFDKFDTDQDGTISLQELKAGLEKQLETQLSEIRVKELMAAFDVSGDNVLQRDEFVTVDKFRNKLNELARNEKERARQAKADADVERDAAKLAEARLDLLNDAPPTTSDKALSILPYLFPLMDGLQYGRFLLVNADESNPVIMALGAMYALYRVIPLSGFVAYFALNFLSANPKINRLVRFNMQQAIFIDIALLFPGLLLGISTFVLPAVGVNLDLPVLTEVSSDVVFCAILATLTYTSISSLLGAAPDKLPLISNAVIERMPSVDMFDDEGRFVGKQKDDSDKKDKQ
jgi:hypothetical protein